MLTRRQVQTAIAQAPRDADLTYFRRTLGCKSFELTQRIDVLVKPSHVSDGAPLEPGCCAMCFALEEQRPDDLGHWVLPFSVLIFRKDGIYKGKPDTSLKNIEKANDTGKGKPASMVVASILPVPPSETRAGQAAWRAAQKEKQTVDVSAHSRHAPGAAPAEDAPKTRREYRRGVGTTFAGLRTAKKWKDLQAS